MPLPAGLTLALVGLTYPLYLLHMQLGYVLFEHQAPADAVPLVVTIVAGVTLLAWAVWRYLERPAQRWTRAFLTRHATRLGWPAKADAAVASAAGGGTGPRRGFQRLRYTQTRAGGRFSQTRFDPCAEYSPVWVGIGGTIA